MKDLIDFLSESKMPKPKRQVSISKKHKPLLQQKRMSVHENHSVLQILKNEYNNSKKNVRSAGQSTLNRTSNSMSMNSISLSNLSMMSDGSLDSFISDLDDDTEEIHKIRYKNQPAHYTKFVQKDANGKNIPQNDVYLEPRNVAQSVPRNDIPIPPSVPKLPNKSEIAQVSQVVEQVNDYSEMQFMPRASNLPDSDTYSSSSDGYNSSEVSSIPPQQQYHQIGATVIPNKKSVQFSNVDVIKRDHSLEALDELEMKDWSTSRSTQTHDEIINGNFESLSKQELVTQLIASQLENEEARNRLHLLVDENGVHVKKYDQIQRIKEELFTKHDQVMSQYTLLKSDYATIQNTLLQTRQQLQQSNNKSGDLEKLSTRALKKIKDLDGENKFLMMQVDWLRNKLNNMEMDVGDESSFSSSATSLLSAVEPIKKKTKKSKKQRNISEETGWETEI